MAKEIRDLIHRISLSSPTWGSPRIVAELKKLGIDVAKSTVEKYMVKRLKPPSPTWRTFLNSHVKDLVSMDFFIVPTAEWTAQQVIEAFPWDEAPRYLLRDRDSIYGATFRRRIKNMGIEEVMIAPRSPWQSPYVERLIGSIRRECLANLVILNERHLRRHLASYFEHYHRWRCHQSLSMDCPVPRPVQQPEMGDVVEIPEAGGLYHHFDRLAA